MKIKFPEDTAPIIVTGAHGGIGRAVTNLLRQNGKNVVAWDLPENDVTDPQHVAQELDAIEHELGPIGGLVHAAGVMHTDSALFPSAHALTACMDVNFLGTVNMCSSVAQRMTQNRCGSIVVVSSNAARVPRTGMSAYCASKAATTAWTKNLGLECAAYGVRCNIVSPGSTDTAMLHNMTEPNEYDESHPAIKGSAENFRLGIPLGRIATPHDIAQCCWFLLSPAAQHITMHDLRVDGGATLDA